jgi:hypothetical protein
MSGKLNFSSIAESIILIMALDKRWHEDEEEVEHKGILEREPRDC